MNIKKMTHLTCTIAFSALIMNLCAQPFGYPYDPYVDANRPEHSPYPQPQGIDPDQGFPQRSPPPANPRNYNAPLKLKSQPSYNNLKANSQNPDAEESLEYNQEKIDQILNFWFGPLSSPDSFPVHKIPLWEGTEEGNRELKAKFYQDYLNAARGQYTVWRQTPRGLLALIILLDIFPRHFFPNQAKMFATDPMALGLAKEGIQQGEDLKLLPIERVFFYMPFQQSEDRQTQELAIQLYQKLMQQSPEQIKPMMQEFLKLATKHKQTIERFNRFPHRNKILERQSTPEEIQYLSQEFSLRY